MGTSVAHSGHDRVNGVKPTVENILIFRTSRKDEHRGTNRFGCDRIPPGNSTEFRKTGSNDLSTLWVRNWIFVPIKRRINRLNHAIDV
jgi:hypothetical protein